MLVSPQSTCVRPGQSSILGLCFQLFGELYSRSRDVSRLLHLQRPQHGECDLHFDWMDQTPGVFVCVRAGMLLSVSAAEMMRGKGSVSAT